MERFDEAFTWLKRNGLRPDSIATDITGGLVPTRFGVNMAVNRTTPDGTPAGGWHAHERVSLMTAHDAYTSGAAYASFDEQGKCTIAPGMLADLAVMTKDCFALPSARILEAEVAATIFDGKIVYEK